MDLPDISAAFKFGSNLINAQAFSSLVSLLRKDPKHIPNRNLFFDCLHLFGEQLSAWSYELLPTLIIEGIFTDQEVFQEIISRLKWSDETENLLLKRFLSLNCFEPIKTVLHILQKEPRLAFQVASILINDIENSEKWDAGLRTMLYCNDVPKEAKLIISFYFDSKENDVTVQLSKLNLKNNKICFSDPFTVAKVLLCSPHLVADEDMPRSYVLLPILLSMTKILADIHKIHSGSMDALSVRNVMIDSMQVSLTDCGSSTSNRMNTYKLLQKLAKDNPSSYLKLWHRHIKADNLKVYSEEMFLFAAALLPFSDTRLVTSVMNLIVKRMPCLANAAFNFYMLLLTKPHCTVDKQAIMESIEAIACSRYVIEPISKFLALLAQKTNDSLSLKVLTNLVLEYVSIVDVIIPLTTISDGDNEKRMEERLLLLQNAILSSNRTDDLLPILNRYLSHDDPVLSIAIKVLVEISVEEELDLKSLHVQLSKRVRLPGNESALAQYCSFLALSKSLDTESDQEFKTSCIQELWSLTTFESTKSAAKLEIRQSAWAALGDCELEEILVTCSITSKDLVNIGKCVEFAALEGYQILLHKVICAEVEDLPRPIYTKEYFHIDPILATCNTWYDALCRTNNESPWLWKATLGLSPYLVSSCPEDRRKTHSLRILRRLLTNVPQPRSFTVKDFVNNLASWRMFIKECLHVLTKEKNSDFIWARDQITEECGKALRQTELCLTNVIFLLTAMILELFAAEKELPLERRKEFNIGMKPWFVAACHFIIPLTDSMDNDLKGFTNPIFQTAVKNTPYSVAVAKFCDWILTRFSLGPKYSDSPSFSNKNGYDPFTTDDDLTASYLKLMSKSTNFIGSRNSLYSLGSALGVSPLRLSLLSEYVEDKKELCLSLDSLLDKDNGNILPEDLTSILDICSNLPVVYRHEFKNKVKRKIERAWSNDNASQQAIYEGLAEYCRSTLPQNSESLPLNYDYLSEKSTIRSVVAEIMELAFPCCVVKSLIHALSPIERSDKRTLPPLNWASVLDKIIYEPGTAEIILKLAVQEKSRMVIYKLSYRYLKEKNTAEGFFLIYTKNLPFVVSCLTEDQLTYLFDKLLEIAVSNSREKQNILDSIASCKDNSFIHDYIRQKMPSFEIFDSDATLDNIVLQTGLAPQYEGQISVIFDFYIEAGREREINFNQLLLLYEASQHNPNCLRALGYQLYTRSIEYLLGSVLVLASVHNLHKSSGNYKVETLDFFLVLVCAIPSELPLPWLVKDDIKNIILERWRYFWYNGFITAVNEKNASVIQRFLLSHLVVDRNAEYKSMIREMIFSLFSKSKMKITDILKYDSLERHQLFSLGASC